VRDQFDNHAKAARLTLPVLIIHGSDDDVIPIAMARRLATVFPDARLYIAPGAHHNDLLDIDGQRVFDAITAFAKGERLLG
jgi:pimeloyl-ACP methyl ester carboxylesterase